MVSHISQFSTFNPALPQLEAPPKPACAGPDVLDVEQVEKTTGTGLASTVASKILEYGRGFLENPKFIGPGINIAPGVAVGFRVEGSLHTKASPLVAQNPFRLAATTALEKENPRQTIVWTQTGGILELGIGLSGTLPLGQFAGLQYGFVPSALMRYRCITPHSLGFFETKSSRLNDNTVLFPFNASNAKCLKAGAEYELCGQGRLRISAALALNLGTPVNSVLNGGVGASAFVNTAHAHELAVNVLALDGANRVRVTVRKVDEKIAQLGAMAYAGVIAQIGPQFPSIGTGLLQGGANLLSSPISDSMNGYYTSLSAQVSTSERNTDQVVAVYDLDLSKPEACTAYGELLKLSCEAADILSAKTGSGVRQLQLAQKEHESRDEFSAHLFGDKLFLYQALCNEKDGQFTDPNGETTLFHQAQFSKHESGWFSPTRDVLWESVSLQNPELKNPKTFFRFQFQKQGDMQELEYNDYFGLANALSLPGREDAKHVHPNSDVDIACKKILTASENVTQATDIYFTEEGINNISKATQEDAARAYCASIGLVRKQYDMTFLEHNPKLKLQLTPLLKKYIAECNDGWFLNFGHFKRLADLDSSYQKLCNRPIHIDAITFSNAQLFSQSIAQLKDVEDSKEIQEFFVGIGKSKGFRYKCWIGALAILATDKETLVHQHELSADGAVFKYNDEGKLEEPSEIIRGLLGKTL